jgi:hypothetical protein
MNQSIEIAPVGTQGKPKSHLQDNTSTQANVSSDYDRMLNVLIQANIHQKELIERLKAVRSWII